jgi:hypothetical protein
MDSPSKDEQPRILECAFSYTENSMEWAATITFKCPVCGRRNRVEANGPGKLYENLPVVVKCKLGHETEVKPYRS